MDADLVLICILCLCLGMPILMYIGSSLEAKDFNGGVCRHCGKKLRYFDTDSRGGRGYICDSCGYVTWVSYNRVDKNYID